MNKVPFSYKASNHSQSCGNSEDTDVLVPGGPGRLPGGEGEVEDGGLGVRALSRDLKVVTCPPYLATGGAQLGFFGDLDTGAVEVAGHAWEGWIGKL